MSQRTRKVAGGRPDCKKAERKHAARSNSPFRMKPVVVTGALLAIVISVVWVMLAPPTAPDLQLTKGDRRLAAGEGRGEAKARPEPTAGPIEDNPAADGWDSEAFHLAAKKRLQPLKASLLGKSINKDELQTVLSRQFTCPPLRPPNLAEVHRDKTFTIRRVAKAGAEQGLTEQGQTEQGQTEQGQPPSPRPAGPGQWDVACQGLLKLFAGTTDRHVGLKIFSLRQQDKAILCRTLVEITGKNREQRIQLKTVWLLRWQPQSAPGQPVLASIQIEDYEETIARAPAGPLFIDRATDLFADSALFRDQFQVGLDRWMEQIPTFSGPVRWGDQGTALGDANGDGLDDLYLCEPTMLPNRLFLRQPDGTLQEASAAAGVDWLDHSRSALFLDLDNDGDQDLAVSLQSALVLAENDGQGNFTPRVHWFAMADAHSLAAADYDQDGRLDLFACGYHGKDDQPEVYPLPIPYHDATNGGANLLLHNDGAWKFHDATNQAGMGVENHRWSLAASWADYDNDGDADLYVANDFGRNQLFRNDGGTFTNVAAKAGVEDVGSGMSVVWGDPNHDGWLDLYVSNMFSTAGGRITSQAKFRAGRDRHDRQQYAQMAAGNSLFQNQADGTFRNVAPAADVQRARWAWGAAFADLNNDTWDDLVVANGFITRKDLRDL